MEIVIAATIAAIPSSLAAWAAWKSARNTATSNGHRLGRLAELNHTELRVIRADLEMHKLTANAHLRADLKTHNRSSDAHRSRDDSDGVDE
jgi:hypothetical protein